MFIRKVRKTDPKSGKKYFYYQLVESYRTPKGPRQRTLLNLGSLDLDAPELKDLANRIEEILNGSKRLFEPSQKIEKLARHYATLLRKKKLKENADENKKNTSHYETVDINSVKHDDVKEIGCEIVGHWAYNQLEFSKILRRFGFTKAEIDRAKVLILGKLINPGSEREIYNWFTERSGLFEIMGIETDSISLSSLYRIQDKLITNKEEIEKELVLKERELFGLGEKLILYDLTNTYFEGVVSSSELSQRGHSKDKRHDRPLVTLGLIIDEDGFPKASKIFKGNVSEPSTLNKILDELMLSYPRLLTRPTVVMDAGISTEENLDLIKKRGLDYICVDRRRVSEIPEGEGDIVHKSASGVIKAIRVKRPDEVFLYCQSTGRAQKEESIKTKFQQRFEKDLETLNDGLGKKGRIKKYIKVLEKIGRIKQKYSSIAQFYDIKVKEKDGIATEITWKIRDKDRLKIRFSGAYNIRTSRTDLSDQEIWQIYNLLTNIEASFKSLKQDLNVRPVYHRIDKRITGHIFTTILAYHLLCIIQRGLKQQKINHNWNTIRNYLRTMVRVTTTLVTEEGKTIYLRQTSEPEPMHIDIFSALGIPQKPLKRVVKVN